MILDVELLSRLAFGSGKAETEAEQFDSWFLPTGLYDRLCRDEHDIVVAPRGTGKSAMYMALLLRNEIVNEPTCHVVEAIDLNRLQARQSVAAFFGSENLAQSQAAQLWKLFFIGQATKWLAEDAGDDRWHGGYDQLQRLGFTVSSPSDSVSFLRRAWQLVTVPESSQDVNHVPSNARGFDDLDDRLENGLSQLCDALDQRSLRIWLALDRLDEVFPDDLSGESRALRSLLIAIKDIDSLARMRRLPFRVKAFLRNDAINRALDTGGIENSSAILQRSIQWDRESVSRAVILRLEPQLRGTTIGKALVDALADGAVAALDAVLPTPTSDLKGMNQVAIAPTTLSWILTFTRDADGIYNPRNIIRLLSAAVDYAAEDLAGNAPFPFAPADEGTHRLVGCRHLYQGLAAASQNALQDVFSEYPALRLFERVSLVVDASDRISINTLRKSVEKAAAGATEVSADNFETLLKKALRSGLMRQENDQLEIGPVYRPALRVKNRHWGRRTHQAQ